MKTITIDAIYDGEVLRPKQVVPLLRDHQYSITISEIPELSNDQGVDAWDVLEAIAGTYDGPSDWSEQHDHYIYGSPKRSVNGGE